MSAFIVLTTGLAIWVGFSAGSEVKNLPAMWETRIQSLGQEDPLEKGMVCPLQYSCLENSMNRGAWWALSGIKESDTTEWLTFSWCVCDCPVILIQVQQEVLVIVQTLPCSARRQPRARQLSRTTLAKETREAPSSIKTLHRSQPSTSFYLSIDGTCLLNKYLRSFTGSQVYCSSAMTCRVSANQSDPTEQLSTQTHTYT